MVIHYFLIWVEQVSSEFIGTERLLCLFGFGCFLPLPLYIMCTVDWIAHVLDRLEVVRNNSRLDIGLQLSWLRLHSSVFLPIPLRIFLGVCFLLVVIGRLIEEVVGGSRIELSLMDLELSVLMVFLYQSLRLFNVLIRLTSSGQTVEWPKERLIHLSWTRRGGLKIPRLCLRLTHGVSGISIMYNLRILVLY